MGERESVCVCLCVCACACACVCVCDRDADTLWGRDLSNVFIERILVCSMLLLPSITMLRDGVCSTFDFV